MSINKNIDFDVNRKAKSAKNRDSGQKNEDLPPGVEHFSTIMPGAITVIEARCKRYGEQQNDT